MYISVSVSYKIVHLQCITTLKFNTMKIVQYIECWQAIDKIGRTYYYEIWQDVTFDTDCNVLSTKTVHKGRCSKVDYLERMQRTKFIEKTDTRILFEN